MSRYARMNPEKGNQVEPPAPALPLKEDAFRWPQEGGPLGDHCLLHPEEHKEARFKEGVRLLWTAKTDEPTERIRQLVRDVYCPVCDGEIPRHLCEQHPDEHNEAVGNAVMAASRVSPCGQIDMPACPVCTLEANDKAYDRKARLAENAEELFRFAKESLPAVRAHAEMAYKLALESGSGTAAVMAQQAESRAVWLAALVNKIDTPEEGK